MNTIRISALCLFLATGLLRAQVPDAPAGAQDAAAQIAALQAPLQAGAAETEKYKATAQTWYASNLDKMQTERTKAGDLDSVVAINAERGRVGAMEQPTEEQVRAMPEAVRKLRATYDASLKKIEDDATRRNDLANRKYLTDLEALQSRITRTGDIEQALVVKAEKERVTEEITANKAAIAAAQPAPPAPPRPNEQKPTPGERVSKFMADNLTSILGPLTAKVEVADYRGKKREMTDSERRLLTRVPHPKVEMPQTELLQLYSQLNAEAAVAAPDDKPRYQAVLAVCIALNNAMKEHQKAATNLDTSLQVQTTNTFGTVTTYRKGQSSYNSSEAAANAKAAAQAVLDKDGEIIARHNARWADLSAKLMQGISNLHTHALQLEKTRSAAR